MEKKNNAFALADSNGWGDFECQHGYGLFSSEYPTEYGDIEALHIEAIDILGLFDSDEEAAEQAIKEIGVAIIKDVPLLAEVFIDSPENREMIFRQINRRTGYAKI